jgi:hypothetical protein
MPKGTAFKEIVQDSGSFFKDVYLVYTDLVGTSDSTKNSTFSRIICNLAISQVLKI